MALHCFKSACFLYFLWCIELSTNAIIYEPNGDFLRRRQVLTSSGMTLAFWFLANFTANFTQTKRLLPSSAKWLLKFGQRWIVVGWARDCRQLAGDCRSQFDSVKKAIILPQILGITNSTLQWNATSFACKNTWFWWIFRVACYVAACEASSSCLKSYCLSFRVLNGFSTKVLIHLNTDGVT